MSSDDDINQANDILIKIIEQSINENKVYNDGSTILHKSAQSGWAIVCDLLLNSGMDVNHKNNFDETPIDIACVGGESDVVNVLLYHGSEVNNNLLFGAINSKNTKLAKLLLSRDINPNIIKDTFTPLLLAALFGDINMIKLLIDYNADVTYINEAGLCIWQCLIKGLILGHSKLHTVKKIIEYLANIHNTIHPLLIFDLVIYGNIELLNYFLDKNLAVNTVSKNKNSLFFCNDYMIDVAIILIDRGIDINYNNLVFHHIKQNNIEIVQLLLSRGVNINIMKNGLNPCDKAISDMNNDMIMLLVEYKCYPGNEYVKLNLRNIIDNTKYIELKTPMKLSSNGSLITSVPIIPSITARFINILMKLCSNTEGLSDDFIQKINDITAFTCYYEF